MKVENEEYEIVGYIKKVCICEKCNQVMEKLQFLYQNDTSKYEMKCPKCGQIDYVDCDTITDQFQLKRRGE